MVCNLKYERKRYFKFLSEASTTYIQNSELFY